MWRLVVVKGGGDLATGIAHRLFRAGFPVIVTELPCPTVVRRTVAFAAAVFDGKVTVEGITAVRCTIEEAIDMVQAGRFVPVVVDPQAAVVQRVHPWAVVDARVAKRNLGTAITDAPVVIGIGPGFTAGADVHAVVETMRGHDLGRVIDAGPAWPDTGIPGEIGGYSAERVLRAPVAGVFQEYCRIGDYVSAGEMVAGVGKNDILAPISGVVRGLLRSGIEVWPGMKVGDIDPRARPEHCWTISDKARAVAGGVLEALLMRDREFGIWARSGVSRKADGEIDIKG